MTIKKPHTVYLPLPGKQWLGRAGVALMVTFALTLLMMSKANNPAAQRLRTNITDMAAPVLAVASSPMDALYNAGMWLTDMSQLREQNVFLKNQNIELLQWQSAAKEMEAENRSLRSLLNVVPPKKNSYITARIVSDLGGPYVHSALVGGGSAQGIKKDEAVTNENGLIGRVIDVGAASARVLLLSDINSRVPVVTEHSQEKSILAGNNSEWPTLSYLAVGSKVVVGERVVTSGDGGIFPPGIPVGVVTAVEAGEVRVQPFADAAKAEYVSIIDYAF